MVNKQLLRDSQALRFAEMLYAPNISIRAARICAHSKFRLLEQRCLSTLPDDPHIYVFPLSGGRKMLTLLSTDPPNANLAIGTTTSIPPVPASFDENPRFLPILQSTLKQYAIKDPQIQARARLLVTQAGDLAGGRSAASQTYTRPRSRHANPAVPRSNNARMTGASSNFHERNASMADKGGWIHVSDSRRQPEFGRTADPEDIFGSVNVDSNGDFIGQEGSYQSSGTYRIVTNEGILGLSPFLRSRLVAKFKEIELHGQV